MHRPNIPTLVVLAGLAGYRLCLAGDVTIAFDSGNAAHVVVPDKEHDIALVLTNADDTAAELTLHVEIESFDGQTAKEQTDLVVPSGRSHRWSIPNRLVGDLGIKWVRYWTERDGRTSESQEAAFAHMHPAGPTGERADGYLLGIAYGAGPDNHAERAAERAALCGVKIARGHPVWPRIQPKPDQWDWSSCDAIVDSHAKYGIEIQFLLSGAPRWSWQPEGKGVPGVDAWTVFCRELAKRYRSKVRYYELWNEPDIGFFQGTQEQYIELLRAGYRAIKEADPSAHVTTCGFAGWSHSQSKPGMVPRVIHECQDSYDFVAYHRHGEFAMFRSELEDILVPYCRNVLKKPRPLYFTETGMDTRFGQRFQARTLPKKIALAWAHGAIAYTWFNLHDMQAAQHARQPGFTYGLYTKLTRIDASQWYSPENMDYDHAWPKAVYVSYNTFASLLADKQYVRRYELSSDQYGYVFSGEREHVVLAWSERPETGAPHLVLATNADRLERVDLMGNRRVWPLANGRTVLPLAAEPAYLLLVGGEAPKVEGTLLAPTGTLTATPGRAVEVQVEVWNPTRQPISLQAKWRIAEGLKANAKDSQLVLAADERKTIAVEATVPRTSNARFGQVFPCTLEYQVEPIGWSGSVTLPVTVGSVFLQRDELPKPPTFRLNRSQQLVNLSEHDPHTVHLLWTGRRDLSADARLCRILEGLKLQIDVQDDIHHAADSKTVADGDHIELFLQVLGQDGTWKVLLAQADGKPQGIVDRAPRGRDPTKAHLHVNAWGEQPWKHYSVTLPDDSFGLSDGVLGEGVRFNLRVHDNDGKGKAGWMQLAPGDTARDSELWPLITIDN